MTAVFQLSSLGHLLSPLSIPQGVIKAIIMGGVNSASSCFLGSSGFPSSSLWLPLLLPLELGRMNLMSLLLGLGSWLVSSCPPGLAG